MSSFTLTVNLAALAALVMFGSAIWTSLTYETGTLRARESLGRALAGLMAVVVLAAVFEAQPFILSGMFLASNKPLTLSLGSGPASQILTALGKVLPSLVAVLAPAAAALVLFAQKLANLAKAFMGEATWRAVLKKYASKLLLCLAAVIVPLLLWVIYLYLCFWATRLSFADGCGPATPDWLQSISRCNDHWSGSTFDQLGPVGTAYLLTAIVLGVICLLIGPNSNSLHRLYRDRLSRAFLFERLQMSSRGEPTSVDTWKFSSLKPFDEKTGEWLEAARYSPYLLTNTAINLEGSHELNKRGRNADTFIFSPLYIGSRGTGYTEGDGGGCPRPRAGDRDGDLGGRGVGEHGPEHDQNSNIQPLALEHPAWLLAA